MKVEIKRHIRTLDEIRKEGKVFGRYYSKTEYIYSVGATLYIEYMREWGSGKRMVKIWSFGNGADFVTEAVPLAMAREAKKALLDKLRTERGIK